MVPASPFSAQKVLVMTATYMREVVGSIPFYSTLQLKFHQTTSRTSCVLTCIINSWTPGLGVSMLFRNGSFNLFHYYSLNFVEIKGFYLHHKCILSHFFFFCYPMQNRGTQQTRELRCKCKKMICVFKELYSEDVYYIVT